MTLRPDLGSVAEELYGKLGPFQDHTLDGRELSDEELGWPLLIFFGLMAKRWQPVDDLSRDSDAGPGWSSIVDIDRAPDEGLGYLGQFKGVTPLRGLTADQSRDRIRYVDGFKRCTAESLKGATSRRLTGTQTVYLNEREGGDPLRIGVITFTAETPFPDLTFQDMIEQKPWGYIIDYFVVDEWGYAVLKVAFDDYGEIKIHYPDYHGLKINVPPAPIV